MNPNEYQEARETAGILLQRYMRGTVDHRLTAGIDDRQLGNLAFWFLKSHEALSVLGQPDDDPLEPHPDPMRNRNDGVA